MRRLPSFLFLLSALGCQGADPAPAAKEPAKLPTTVQEAVDYIVSGMSPQDQSRLRATRREDLINELHGWGRGIRNGFQLWGRNQALLESCGTDSPEGASMVIMEAVWDRVQKK